MVYVGAAAELCSGVCSFGVALVVWSFWIYVGANCLACCLNY